MKARELFPILEYKKLIFNSTFNISIYHHKNYTFLTSMPIQKQVADMNMLWTYFDKSPSMSAQHFTIVITTLKVTSIGNFTFWYRKEIEDQMRFAENIVRNIKSYLEQKTRKIIPKIDYLIIRNFQYSNVKRWGFILLRYLFVFIFRHFLINMLILIYNIYMFIKKTIKLYHLHHTLSDKIFLFYFL